MVLDLEYKNDLASVTFSAPLLTNHGSKGYSEGEAGAITPQGVRTAVLNFSPNIFNNKVVLIEIN